MSRIHDVAREKLQPIVMELAALLEADAILVISLTELGQMRTQLAGDQDGKAYRTLQTMHEALLQGGLVTRQETVRLGEEPLA